MDREQIVTRVNAVMSEGFELSTDKLTPSAKLFEELGLDSLDAVDMMVKLEDQLGIKVQGERLSTVRTMQDVYDLVAEVTVLSKGQQELRQDAG